MLRKPCHLREAAEHCFSGFVVPKYSMPVSLELRPERRILRKSGKDTVKFFKVREQPDTDISLGESEGNLKWRQKLIRF